ncbi:unnamed protein product [Gordionus sp. m RMFG-2023]
MFSAIKEENLSAPVTEEKYEVESDDADDVKKAEQKFKAKYQISNKPLSSNFLQKRLQKGQKFFDSGDYNMAIASKNKSNKAPADITLNNSNTMVFNPNISSPNKLINNTVSNSKINDESKKKNFENVIICDKGTCVEQGVIDNLTLHKEYREDLDLNNIKINSSKKKVADIPINSNSAFFDSSNNIVKEKTELKEVNKRRESTSLGHESNPGLDKNLEDIMGRVIPTPENVPARKASIPILLGSNTIGLPASLKSTQQSHPHLTVYNHNQSHRHSSLQ